MIYTSDAPFQRLEHYKLHEYAKKWNGLPSNNNTPKDPNSSSSVANKPVVAGQQLPQLHDKDQTVSMTLSTNLDSMFKRKRGRPPKNRVVEVKSISKKFNSTFTTFLCYLCKGEEEECVLCF